jgi:S1-C subfamily serine protease
VTIDENIGLGVLKIDSSAYPVLQFGSLSVKIGDSVLAIGARGKLALEPAAGIVKSIEERFVNVQFDIDIQGFGGGPVLDRKGLIIGIIHSLKSTDQNNKIDQCIRSDKIQDYLRNLKIRN